MKELKSNLPLILLIAIVPYFFYQSPTIPQAIIAASLAALVGFKYFLEHNSLPDYKAIFEAQIKDRDEKMNTRLKDLDADVSVLKEKQSIKGIAEITRAKRENVNW